MNHQSKFKLDIFKGEAFSSIPCKIFFALVLLTLPAGAQFAPTSLAFPSNVTWVGTSIDSNDGLVAESADIQFTSATTFTTAPAGGGTYTYLKTGPNTATLDYNFSYSEPGYSETEIGTVLLTFTTAAGGTFTSSGSYVLSDYPFSGTFSGTGDFTYTAPNTAPTISDVSDKSTNVGTATSAIAFTISDIETSAADLTVTRASSNTTLVPLVNVVLDGLGASRTVTITPAANQSGTSIITLTVSDGALTATDTFVLTVIGQTVASWRQTHFSSPDNSGNGADTNDFDKDGIVNLMEYALGSIPTNPASANHPVSGIETFSGQPYLTMTISKPPGIIGITYVVEVSESLVGWGSGPANTTIITNDSNTLKVRDNTPASGGIRFIRLKVTNP